ncbi:MAG: MinD/ParA family protein [Gammaproteobacteria bacterium]|nr:MinD/ParA family protein [Gammaproteobacteria bacterium]
MRALAAHRPVKVIAVASGKGGVGKTNVAVNLAVGFSSLGRSTLLLDADLGLANVDVLLGLQPAANIAEVVSGRMDLEDILVDGPEGLKIVPAASGIAELADLDPRQYAGLVDAFSTLPLPLDVMIVDTASGISREVTGFCQAAHEVVVVLRDEPASITDAYALIKVMSRDRGVHRFQVLCNGVRDAAHGEALYRTLLRVCDKFLDVTLGYLGAVPEDAALRRAVRRQQAVVEAFPGSPSGRAFKELALRADKWSVPRQVTGRPAFFLERQLQVFRSSSERGARHVRG